MHLKRIVLCALLVIAAAPSNAAPTHDSIVPEIELDQDLFATNLLEEVPRKPMPRNDPVVNEEHISRAQPCADDHSCTFDVLYTVHGGTSLPNSEEFLGHHSLSNVKYTVQVSPDAAPWHTKVWKVQGVNLITEGGEQPQQDASHLFQKCSARLVQSNTNGEVLAVLHNPEVEQTLGCPEQLSNLLVTGMKTLVPVKGHTSQQTMFSHRELVGTDHRRVDYTTHSTGKATHVRGQVFHRYFNDDVLMASPEMEQFSDALSSHSTATRTRIIGNTVHQHHTASKVRLAAVKQSESMSSSNPSPEYETIEVPDGATGGEAARRQEDLVQHVQFRVQKTKTSLAPVPQPKDQVVEDFLQEAQADGNQVNDLSHAPVDTHEKKNPFLELNSDEQHAAFDKLVAELPEMPHKVARHECDQVLGTPQGQKIFMERLNNGDNYEIRTSAFLMGGMDRARPLPTDDLVSISNNEDVAWHTRNQAMISLIQPDCAHEHHLHAIDGLADLAGALKKNDITGQYEPGMHTSALHIQHALAKEAVRCSKGAAVSAVTNLLQTTEQFAKQSLAQEDWLGVKYSLLALANSRFERHRHIVRAVQAHPDVPENIAATADWVDGKLPTSPSLVEDDEGDAAGKHKWGVQKVKDAAKSNSITLDYNRDVKLPKDGDAAKKQPNPRFQGQLAFGAKAGGVDDGEGKGKMTWGAGVYAEGKLKLWDDAHTYLVIKAEFGFWIPNPNYPDGKTKPELIIKVGPSEIVVYTFPKPPEGQPKTGQQTIDDKLGGDTSVKLSSTDKIGYCDTDVNALKGFKGTFKIDKTLFEFHLPTIWVGPAPLQLAFRLKGSIGFDIGVGITEGNGGAVSAKCNGGQSTVSSKTSKCGDGKNPANGIMGYIQPALTLTAEAEAAVNAWIARIGAGLSLDVVEVKAPMTAEHYQPVKKNKKDDGGWGFALQLKSSSMNGRFFFFFEWSSWFTSGRKEWEILSFNGFSWNYPEGGQLLGHFTSPVKMPTCTVPKVPDPSETECQVVLYPEPNLSGNERYRYFVSSSKTAGELKTLPNVIQDHVKSAQTMGNCYSAELVDDDVGYSVGDNDNAIVYDVQMTNLPYDLQNDVRSVYIKALPPKTPKPTDWQKYCNTVVYMYPSFIGKQKHFKLGKSDGCRHFKADLYVQSIELSPGCDKIWVQDDDYYADNTYFTASQSSLDNDLVNDIASYKLWNKGKGGSSCTEEELVEAPPKRKSIQKLKRVKNDAAKTRRRKLVKDKCNESKGECCWSCWPKGKGVNTGIFSDYMCWKGSKKEDRFDCKGDTPQRDYNCKCTNLAARRAKRIKDFRAKEARELCAACGTITVFTDPKARKGKKTTDLAIKKKCQADCKAASPPKCSSTCSSNTATLSAITNHAKEEEEEVWFLEKKPPKKAPKKPSKKAPKKPSKTTPAHISPVHKAELAAEKAAGKVADLKAKADKITVEKANNQMPAWNQYVFKRKGAPKKAPKKKGATPKKAPQKAPKEEEEEDYEDKEEQEVYEDEEEE
jgi:hypothetical protein